MSAKLSRPGAGGLRGKTNHLKARGIGVCASSPCLHEGWNEPPATAFVSEGFSFHDDDDDDCFCYHSWRNNVVIAFGTLSSFFYLALMSGVVCVVCPFADDEKLKNIHVDLALSV